MQIETWDLYNQNRERTGQTIERGAEIPNGLYHLVAGAWIINSQGHFIVSKRSPGKNYPNYWECTGGAVRSGENSLSGAIREVKEELGINIAYDNAILFYQTRREVLQDFYDAWLFYSGDSQYSFILQTEEVVDVKWVTCEELYDMYITKELHPLIDYIQKVMDISFRR